MSNKKREEEALKAGAQSIADAVDAKITEKIKVQAEDIVVDAPTTAKMAEQVKFEIKDGVDVSPESKEVIHKVGTGELTPPKQNLEAQAQKIMRDGMEKDAKFKELEAKVAELEVEKAELVNQLAILRAGPQVHPCGMVVIKELRKQDVPKVNRTCSCCAKRVPVKMMEVQRDEFCNDCLIK